MPCLPDCLAVSATRLLPKDCLPSIVPLLKESTIITLIPSLPQSSIPLFTKTEIPLTSYTLQTHCNRIWLMLFMKRNCLSSDLRVLLQKGIICILYFHSVRLLKWFSELLKNESDYYSDVASNMCNIFRIVEFVQACYFLTDEIVTLTSYLRTHTLININNNKNNNSRKVSFYVLFN